MRNVFILFCFGCLFGSCVNAQKKALDRVLELESKLMAVQDASANVDLAKEVLVAYSDFLKAYPDAESNPEILFKSGEVFKGLGQYLQAAQAFYKVHYNFPNSKLAPLAIFQQADCFEVLEQRLTAKNTYEEFIERYPNHPYVEQAKGMIQLLHFSDEELINQFQK
jgi:tetratricopeptide (TPR) repeat protein